MALLQGEFNLLLGIDTDLIVSVKNGWKVCIKIQVVEGTNLRLDIGNLARSDASPRLVSGRAACSEIRW